VTTKKSQERVADNHQRPVKSFFLERKLCDGISSADGVEFLEETIAGYTCVGGTYDDKDSNEEPFYVTEKIASKSAGGPSTEPIRVLDLNIGCKMKRIFIRV